MRKVSRKVKRSENGNAEAHAIPGPVEAERGCFVGGSEILLLEGCWGGKSNKENGRLGMLIDVVDFKSGKVGRGGRTSVGLVLSLLPPKKVLPWVWLASPGQSTSTPLPLTLTSGSFVCACFRCLIDVGSSQVEASRFIRGNHYNY